jgi:molybdopterin-containing oxidoreductase family membrane subunit
MDDALEAVKKVKSVNMEYRMYSPVPRHEIEEVTYPEKSPVRIFSLVGAITGCTAGFALAILCSLDWPMRTSAKNVVSIPAFFVPGYEWTILFGGLCTMLAILILCRLPSVVRAAGYDPRFSCDKFGVVVACAGSQVEDVKRRMLDSGADEVDVRDSL